MGQFLIFCAPFHISVVKRLRNAAPADVLNEHRLLFAQCRPIFGAQGLQQLLCCDVVTISRFCAAFPQPVGIGNHIVPRTYINSVWTSCKVKISCSDTPVFNISVASSNIPCSRFCCSNRCPSRMIFPPLSNCFSFSGELNAHRSSISSCAGGTAPSELKRSCWGSERAWRCLTVLCLR